MTDTNGRLPERLFATDQYPDGRLNIYSKPELIHLVRKLLKNTDQWKRMAASCFGPLFKLPVSNCALSCKLIHGLLTRQLNTPKKYEMWTVFGGQPLRFSLAEFANVTGLPCGDFPKGYAPDVEDSAAKKGTAKKGTTKFWKELLGDVDPKTTSLTHVTDLLQESIAQDRLRNSTKKKKKEDGLRKFRLALILIVDGVLIAGNQTPRPTPKYVEMLKNVDSFLAFPWGRECFRKTITAMRPRRNVGKKVKVNPVKRFVLQLQQQSMAIPGFPLALQLLALKNISNLVNLVTDPSDTRTLSAALNVPRQFSCMTAINGAEQEDNLRVVPFIDEFVAAWGDEVDDEEEDKKVEYMMGVIRSGYVFKKNEWPGGDSSLPFITLPKEEAVTKTENVVHNKKRKRENSGKSGKGSQSKKLRNKKANDIPCTDQTAPLDVVGRLDMVERENEALRAEVANLYELMLKMNKTIKGNKKKRTQKGSIRTASRMSITKSRKKEKQHAKSSSRGGVTHAEEVNLEEALGSEDKRRYEVEDAEIWAGADEVWKGIKGCVESHMEYPSEATESAEVILPLRKESEEVDLAKSPQEKEAEEAKSPQEKETEEVEVAKSGTDESEEVDLAKAFTEELDEEKDGNEKNLAKAFIEESDEVDVTKTEQEKDENEEDLSKSFAEESEEVPHGSTDMESVEVQQLVSEAPTGRENDEGSEDGQLKMDNNDCKFSESEGHQLLDNMETEGQHMDGDSNYNEGIQGQAVDGDINKKEGIQCPEGDDVETEAQAVGCNATEREINQGVVVDANVKKKEGIKVTAEDDVSSERDGFHSPDGHGQGKMSVDGVISESEGIQCHEGDGHGKMAVDGVSTEELECPEGDGEVKMAVDGGITERDGLQCPEGDGQGKMDGVGIEVSECKTQDVDRGAIERQEVMVHMDKGKPIATGGQIQELVEDHIPTDGAQEQGGESDVSERWSILSVIEKKLVEALLQSHRKVVIDRKPDAREQEYRTFHSTLKSAPKTEHITTCGHTINNSFLLDLAQSRKLVSTPHMEVLVSLLRKRHKVTLLAPGFGNYLQGKYIEFEAATDKSRIQWGDQLKRFISTEWFRDIDRLYLPMIWNDNHWVGVAINLGTWNVEILDPNTTLYDFKEVERFIAPIVEMVPYIIQPSMSHSNEVKPFGWNRIEGIYVNKRTGDCGPVAMKLLEIHVTGGGSKQMAQITDEIVDQFRGEYALDIYAELVAPAYAICLR